MTTDEKELQEKTWTPGERQCGGYTMLRAQTRKHRHLGSPVQKRAPAGGGAGRCSGSGDRSACRLGRRSSRSSPESLGPPPSVLQPRIRFISGVCVGGCVTGHGEASRMLSRDAERRRRRTALVRFAAWCRRPETPLPLSGFESRLCHRLAEASLQAKSETSPFRQEGATYRETSRPSDSSRLAHRHASPG